MPDYRIRSEVIDDPRGNGLLVKAAIERRGSGVEWVEITRTERPYLMATPDSAIVADLERWLRAHSEVDADLIKKEELSLRADSLQVVLDSMQI